MANPYDNEFGITIEDLGRLTCLDNNITEKMYQTQIKEDFDVKYPDRLICTKILMEEFGAVKGLLSKLQVDPEIGISDLEVHKRQQIFGINEDTKVKIRGLCELIMDNFEDKINQILLVACIVSIIIGLIKEGFPDGLVDGISIAFALIIITVVSSFNNFISERKLKHLVEINNVKRPVMVLRSGIEKQYNVSDLVVGDIYQIKAGSEVPAESVLIRGKRMLIDESAITGESVYKEKIPSTYEN